MRERLLTACLLLQALTAVHVEAQCGELPTFSQAPAPTPIAGCEYAVKARVNTCTNSKFVYMRARCEGGVWSDWEQSEYVGSNAITETDFELCLPDPMSNKCECYEAEIRCDRNPPGCRTAWAHPACERKEQPCPPPQITFDGPTCDSLEAGETDVWDVTYSVTSTVGGTFHDGSDLHYFNAGTSDVEVTYSGEAGETLQINAQSLCGTGPGEQGLWESEISFPGDCGDGECTCPEIAIDASSNECAITAVATGCPEAEHFNWAVDGVPDDDASGSSAALTAQGDGSALVTVFAEGTNGCNATTNVPVEDCVEGPSGDGGTGGNGDGGTGGNGDSDDPFACGEGDPCPGGCSWQCILLGVAVAIAIAVLIYVIAYGLLFGFEWILALAVVAFIGFMVSVCGPCCTYPAIIAGLALGWIFVAIKFALTYVPPPNIGNAVYFTIGASLAVADMIARCL